MNGPDGRPTVTTCPRCGGCVLCGHADDCPDPAIEISGDPGKSQCAITQTTIGGDL